MLHMLETTVALVATYLYSTDSTSTYTDSTSLCTTLFPPGRRCCTSHNDEGEAHSEEEAQEDEETARASGADGKSIVSNGRAKARARARARATARASHKEQGICKAP